MNKLIIIKIIYKLFDNYLSDSLSYDIVGEIIKSENDFDFVDNEITSNENLFLIFLFSSVPYYKIHDTLNDFIQTINRITECDKYLHSISNLVEAYISDLSSTIYERIRTELDSQLLYLFNNYYNDAIDAKHNISILLKNMCDPKELFHKDYLDGMSFQQISFLDVDEDINLKEEVSKKNYYKKHSAEKKLINTLSSCLNKEQLDDFISNLNDLLESASGSIDDKDIYNLLRLYNSEISYLYNKINIKIENAINNDRNIRYILQSYNKKQKEA